MREAHLCFAGPLIKLRVGDFWPVFEKWMEAGQKTDKYGYGMLESVD